MSIRKITEDEVQALWVQRLPDTPNRTARFGTAGLSAREMKAAYDALPLRIVAHFNEVVDLILGGEINEAIKTPTGKTLSAFFHDVTSGELATYLTVDGARTLAALAAALDTHDHSGKYAELGGDGRIDKAALPAILADILPTEAERQSAEAERAAAEEKRALAELSRADAAAAAAEAAADVIAAILAAEAERQENFLAFEARIVAAEERVKKNESTLLTYNFTLENLAAATQGATHVFVTDAERSYRKIVPDGALPYARLVSLGGASTNMARARVTAVVSHGANVLPYPFPSAECTLIGGLSFDPTTDGGILVSGTAYEDVFYPIYARGDGLALPEGAVYVDPIGDDGVCLYLRTEEDGEGKNGACTVSATDGYFGDYEVYLFFPAGIYLQGATYYPIITRGEKARPGVAYHAPYRFEIPEEILALNGYGYSTNYLYFDKGYYYVRIGDSGSLLPAVQYLPISEEFALSAWLPVEPGGELVFENDKGSAIRSEILYGVRL